jgi:DNA-binding MarR family transcriptional regulator
VDQGDQRRAAPPQRLWRLPTWLLAHLSQRSQRLVIDALATPAARHDYAVLGGLAEFGPVSQAELGRRLGLDRSDVVALLNRLEAAGQARRASDADDPRRNAVSITREGSRRLRALDALVERAQVALLEPLSAAEGQQFVALLQRLVDHHTGFVPPPP